MPYPTHHQLFIEEQMNWSERCAHIQILDSESWIYYKTVGLCLGWISISYSSFNFQYIKQGTVSPPPPSRFTVKLEQNRSIFPLVSALLLVTPITHLSALLIPRHKINSCYHQLFRRWQEALNLNVEVSSPQRLRCYTDGRGIGEWFTCCLIDYCNFSYSAIVLELRVCACVYRGWTK